MFRRNARQPHRAPRSLQMELLGQRVLLAADLGLDALQPETESPATVGHAAPQQNPLNRFDVNGDSIVSPLDALLVADDFQRRNAEESVNPEATDAYFTDVDGDGQVTRDDFEHVVRRLNGAHDRPLPEQPESEPATESMPLDVDASGTIDALDAELIRDHLSVHGPTSLASGEWDDAVRRLDTNGDTLVTPHDLLLVVNYLNQQPSTAQHDDPASASDAERDLLESPLLDTSPLAAP